MKFIYFLGIDGHYDQTKHYEEYVTTIASIESVITNGRVDIENVYVITNSDDVKKRLDIEFEKGLTIIKITNSRYTKNDNYVMTKFRSVIETADGLVSQGHDVVIMPDSSLCIVDDLEDKLVFLKEPRSYMTESWNVMGKWVDVIASGDPNKRLLYTKFLKDNNCLNKPLLDNAIQFFPSNSDSSRMVFGLLNSYINQLYKEDEYVWGLDKLIYTVAMYNIGCGGNELRELRYVWHTRTARQKYIINLHSCNISMLYDTGIVGKYNRENPIEKLINLKHS